MKPNLEIGDSVRYVFRGGANVDSFPAFVTRVRLDGAIDCYVTPDHPTGGNNSSPARIVESFDVTKLPPFGPDMASGWAPVPMPSAPALAETPATPAPAVAPGTATK